MAGKSGLAKTSIRRTYMLNHREIYIFPYRMLEDQSAAYAKCLKFCTNLNIHSDSAKTMIIECACLSRDSPHVQKNSFSTNGLKRFATRDKGSCAILKVTTQIS